MTKNQPKILFFVTEDWAFYLLHRHMARAARDAGMDVYVLTRVRDFKEKIEKEGFHILPLELSRGSLNPFKELRTLLNVIKIYRKERPNLVVQVAAKPAIYGSFAAWLCSVPALVNLITGLGAFFINKSFKYQVIRRGIVTAFRLLLNRKNARVVVQNDDDVALFKDKKIVDPKRVLKIKGSGVDLSMFPVTAEPKGLPVITVVARMLWDKGIGELVKAAEILKERDIEAKIVMVGEPDPENPKSIPARLLRKWHEEGLVQWHGGVSNEKIPQLWEKTHIAVLPSYREGLPTSLLEASAAARPMVTTDVPGCRELVKDGVNGLLVPAKDPLALADALEKLILDPALRVKLGKKAREIIEKECSADVIGKEYTKLFDHLLKENT